MGFFGPWVNPLNKRTHAHSALTTERSSTKNVDQGSWLPTIEVCVLIENALNAIKICPAYYWRKEFLIFQKLADQNAIAENTANGSSGPR